MTPQSSYHFTLHNKKEVTVSSPPKSEGWVIKYRLMDLLLYFLLELEGYCLLVLCRSMSRRTSKRPNASSYEPATGKT
jgi:hypothetical protein